MHTLHPTHHLLTLALLGVIGGAILTTSLQGRRVAIVNRSASEATKVLTVAHTGGQDQNASSWQMLKRKSDRQIKDNDKRIRNLKACMTGTSKAFLATYAARVSELERRNIALKEKLNSHGSGRGER